MSKCFVLGAGFSNAVAELPLTRDLLNSFKKVQEAQVLAKNELRVGWGENIKMFLVKLEAEFIHPRRQSAIQEGCNEWSIHYTDLESILTFIDSNLISPLHTELVVNHERVDSFKESPYWSGIDLKEIRSCIQTYVYLSLDSNCHTKESLGKFIDQLNIGDTIVSFNYDLVLDRALFKKRIWKPKDGYGATFQRFPNISNDDNNESQILLLKLHGSLNWENGTEGSTVLSWFDDKRKPYFDGYAEVKPPPFDYQGKYTGRWILPSYIKPLNSELFISLWKKAHDALTNAEQVVVIGYSLPDADSTSRLLMASTRIDKKGMIVVDHNCNEVIVKFAKLTGNENYKTFSTLDNYLKS